MVEYGGMVEVGMVQEPTYLGPHGMRRGRCQIRGSLENDTNKFEVLDTLYWKDWWHNWQLPSSVAICKEPW